MAWIETASEDTGTGKLKSIYRQQQEQAGAVANILKIHSLAPTILEAHLGLYSAVMHAPGPFSRKHREMIALVVSVINECHY